MIRFRHKKFHHLYKLNPNTVHQRMDAGTFDNTFTERIAMQGIKKAIVINTKNYTGVSGDVYAKIRANIEKQLK